MKLYTEINKEETIYALEEEQLERKYVISNNVVLIKDEKIFEDYELVEDEYNSFYDYCISNDIDAEYVGSTDADGYAYLDDEDIERYAKEYPYAVENDELIDTDYSLSSFQNVLVFEHYKNGTNLEILELEEYGEEDEVLEYVSTDKSEMPYGYVEKYTSNKGNDYNIYISCYAGELPIVVDDEDEE